MEYSVRDYKSIKGLVEMPIVRPVRISTSYLSTWAKIKVYFQRREWELVEDYVLYIPWLKTSVLIPKGYVFDAASVPRMLWPLIDPTGILLIGSLFHDFGYQYNCFINERFEEIKIPVNNRRKFFDRQIRDINIYVNDYNFMNKTAYSTLRGFGWWAWRNYRKKNNQVSEDFKLNKIPQQYCEQQEVF